MTDFGRRGLARCRKGTSLSLVLLHADIFLRRACTFTQLSSLSPLRD